MTSRLTVRATLVLPELMICRVSRVTHHGSGVVYS